MLIDTHSHIFSEEFDTDRAQVLNRAFEAGIRYHVLPNIDSSTTEKLMDVCREFPQCFPLMGLHPTSVKIGFESEIDHVEQMLATNKFYGIGEIGIDLYWDKTYLHQQQEAFRYQLNLAKKFHLPLVIHARNSFNEIFEILDQEIDSTLFGVFHSFTGNIDDYKHIAGYQHFYVGIGGIVTYKNGGVSTILQHINPEHILLETDSPFLSPVPVRGRRNESYNLTYIAIKVAEVLGVSVLEVAQQTTKNAVKLFKLPVE